ncbi:MAG: Hsp20/alpha crystallin family protein, partial [Saprospiraceae bacterium]|nr:Hsp20/alpha crystallin family protein [Saprospiraceae bacterium]
MRLTNWRNFSHPASYRRSLDDFFNDRYRNLLGMTGDFTPAMNTSEKKESYEIEVAAPGLKKDDFEITVNNGMLTITCDSSSEREEEDNHYVSREFSYHSF